MDNLTDTLVAVMLARAGLNRLTPAATALLVLAANLPDMDLASLLFGRLTAFEIHRGYTHCVLAIPALAAITVLIIRFWTKLPLIRSFLVASVGVATHLLLDATGNYGIRPWLPFSSRWFYLDLNAFYDSVILVLLVLAFLWPWFVGLVSSEIGRKTRHQGRGSAVLVLCLIALYEGGRWTLHQRALKDLSARFYDGEAPSKVSAWGDANNPLEWTGVVETSDTFRLVRSGTLDLEEGTDARIFRKIALPAMDAGVEKWEPFRYLRYFSRFPVWSMEPAKLMGGVGEMIKLTDLRFGGPGVNHVQASAVVDSKGRVLESHFDWSAGF